MDARDGAQVDTARRLRGEHGLRASAATARARSRPSADCRPTARARARRDCSAGCRARAICSSANARRVARSIKNRPVMSRRPSDDVIGDRRVEDEPAVMTILGNVRETRREPGAPACRPSRSPMRTRPRCVTRPATARASSRWPLPSTPATRRSRPARTREVDVAQRVADAEVVEHERDRRLGSRDRFARRRQVGADHRARDRTDLERRSQTSRPSCRRAAP